MTAATRLHLLYVIDSLAGGGAETSLALVAPYLEHFGINLTVVTLFDREGLEDSIRKANISLYSLSNATSRASRVRALRSLIKELKPDLVHTTLFEADLVGRLAGWLAATPVTSSLVNTPYGREHFGEPGVRTARLLLAWLADAVTARLVSEFHSISATTKLVMARRLLIRRSRIRVVYRGRPDPAGGLLNRATLRASLGIDPYRPVLLAVGRQEPQKGLETAVAALGGVVEEIPEVCLVLVGRPGRSTGALEERIRATGLSAQVMRLGHRQDIAELMYAADLLVCSSLREGLGGVVIEAMAASLPIVCTDLPIFREITDHHDGPAAAFATVGSAEDFAARIIEVLSDEHLARDLGARGRSVFVARHSLEREAEQLSEFWFDAFRRCRQTTRR